MEYLKGLKKNVVLAKYTTYKIGGPADYFYVAKNTEDVKTALNFAGENGIPVFILAGGSNVLFGDNGFRGLIIKIENQEIKFDGYNAITGAGAPMDYLVKQTVEKGYKGLEWAGGLPGTLGGAIRGNAGCFGGEVKNITKEVSAMTMGGEIKTYANKDCRFGYRDSIFKHNNEIILSAILEFGAGDRDKLRQKVFDHIKYRATKHSLPSCGSVFKNCTLESIPDEIVEGFKDKIKTDPFPVLPAAVLIGAAGLTGKTIGGAKITEGHANIIVNFNNAKAKDVLGIINLVKETVIDKFGVKLNEEVEFVGFD